MSAGALEPVRSWRIHLGAHKTATTHLQETLAAARASLAEKGIDYIPNPDIRENKLAPTLWRRRPIARVPILGPSRMREVIEAVLEPLRIGPGCVVLSEENIIGVPHQILETPIYPQVTTSVSRLASLGLQAELALFLSIRSYDTLVPSAYAEALKHAPPPEGGFATVRERLLAAPPSWFDLVHRICTAAPMTSLRIWRQEDYRANSRAIMEEFCGIELGALPQISDPSWTRSPSAEGIAVAEALPADLTRAERRRRVVAIYEEFGGQERFRPFGAAERRKLRAAYEADIERIARVYPDVMLRFGPKELAA